MKVLLFDPISSGHHAVYLSHIIKALRKLPVHIVTAVASGADQQPEYQSCLLPLSDSFQLDQSTILQTSRASGSASQRYHHLRRLIDEHHPDHVYLPYADGLAQRMALGRLLNPRLGPREMIVEGLIMRASHAYAGQPIKQRFKSTASFFAARHAGFDRLFLLDPIPYEYEKKRRPHSGDTLRLMPDPVQSLPDLTQAQARQALNLSEGKRYISCSGGLDTRKGVDLLIQAFGQASFDQSVCLLLAGRADPHVREQLAGQAKPLVEGGQVIVWDRYVSDHELNCVNLASDLICTPYPRHVGSASIAIRAAAAGRPVLSSDFGWLGRIVPRFDLGSTTNVTDINGFSQALHLALNQSSTWTPSIAHQQFVAFHSPENFQAHWCQSLIKRLGLTPDTLKLTWDTL